MTPKERFLLAVRGGQPDRVPVFDFLDSKKLFKHLLGHEPDSYNSTDVMAATKMLELDAAFITYGGVAGYDNTGVEEGKDTYKDEWGTVYKTSKYSWPVDSPIVFPIKSKEDLIRYNPPDAGKGSRLDDITKAIELSNNEIAILGGIQGPLTTAFLLAGWDTLAYSIMEDGKLAEDIFKISNEYFSFAAINMIKAGVDVICIAEDLGFEHGPFFSPKTYQKYLYPYIKELVCLIKKENIPVFFHCDGNLNIILEDLIDLGIDCLHPIQRSANMDLKFIKEKYGKKIALCGNVDSSNILPFGDGEKVIRETIECIKTGAPGGGFILASDSDVRDDMPVDNILALFETGKKFGKYPIEI